MVLALAAAATAASIAPATASEAMVGLSAAETEIGYVTLTVASPVGGTATVSELRDGRVVPLGVVTVPAGGETVVRRAAAWRCSRRRRVFTVTLTAADGSQSSATTRVRTPSCDGRFRLVAVPGHPLVGHRVRVRIEDRWRLDASSVRICARGPGPRSCRRLHPGAAWTWRPPRPGSWVLTVRIDGHRIVRRLRVRPVGGRLRLVAAGDSMIQIVDTDLRERLAGDHVDVRFDDHVSTGITKPFMLNWLHHARSDARAHRPDVTVMFLGANDGYPLPTAHGQAPCCGAAWIRAYAARASEMMRAYARGGRGRVYWMLLPAPRGAAFRTVFTGVNAALRLAAARHPDTVRLVDLGRTFTPGGRFRQVIRWHGRLVSVRQGDGVHLNVAGASIAATLIIRALRGDGVL
jgi:lysophospholipase L1-like esterase